MDGLEIIKAQFEGDQFAKQFGIVLDELSETSIKMHMVLKPQWNNLFNRPHGGVIYALADAAFSVIGNNSNNLSVALDCSITYHKSPDPGETLYVEGSRLAQSRRTGTYLFEEYIINAKGKQQIATMKSIVYRTGKPIDPNTPQE